MVTAMRKITRQAEKGISLQGCGSCYFICWWGKASLAKELINEKGCGFLVDEHTRKKNSKNKRP